MSDPMGAVDIAPKRKMQNITINLPDAYCDAIERLLKRGIFPSRSEAIRVALKEFLDREFVIVDLLGLTKPDDLAETIEEGEL